MSYDSGDKYNILDINYFAVKCISSLTQITLRNTRRSQLTQINLAWPSLRTYVSK